MTVLPLRRLAEAAVWAYGSREKIEANVCECWLYDECHFIENAATDTQCFLAVDRRLPCILSFRGTENWIDLLSDLRASKLDWFLPGRVHEGFLRCARSVEYNILSVLRTLAKTQRHDLIVTGHSLGGALATVFAALQIDRDEAPAAVATFGQPRVFNRVAARWYESLRQQHGMQHHRFVNSSDIVPRVPPAMPGWLLWLLSHSNPVTASLPAIPGGYRHVGELCYFDHCGHLCEGTTRRFRLKDRIQAAVADFGVPGLAMFKKHSSCGQYFELIRKAFPGAML